MLTEEKPDMHCQVLKKVIIAGTLYTQGDKFDVDHVDPPKLAQLISLRYLSPPMPDSEAPSEPRSKKQK
jgi:hypothetical protein